MRALILLLLLAQTGCAAAFLGHCGRSEGETACAAFRGDKMELYELGRRSEFGDGVPIDLKRARDLYRAAASSTPETIYVYSPGINGAAGRVIPVNTGRGGPGLADAKAALLRVKAALVADKLKPSQIDARPKSDR
jgi:hypothetical protein